METRILSLLLLLLINGALGVWQETFGVGDPARMFRRDELGEASLTAEEQAGNTQRGAFLNGLKDQNNDNWNAQAALAAAGGAPPGVENVNMWQRGGQYGTDPYEQYYFGTSHADPDNAGWWVADYPHVHMKVDDEGTVVFVALTRGPAAGGLRNVVFLDTTPPPGPMTAAQRERFQQEMYENRDLLWSPTGNIPGLTAEVKRALRATILLDERARQAHAPVVAPVVVDPEKFCEVKKKKGGGGGSGSRRRPGAAAGPTRCRRRYKNPAPDAGNKAKTLKVGGVPTREIAEAIGKGIGQPKKTGFVQDRDDVLEKMYDIGQDFSRDKNEEMGKFAKESISDEAKKLIGILAEQAFANIEEKSLPNEKADQLTAKLQAKGEQIKAMRNQLENKETLDKFSATLAEAGFEGQIKAKFISALVKVWGPEAAGRFVEGCYAEDLQQMAKQQLEDIIREHITASANEAFKAMKKLVAEALGIDGKDKKKKKKKEGSSEDASNDDDDGDEIVITAINSSDENDDQPKSSCTNTSCSSRCKRINRSYCQRQERKDRDRRRMLRRLLSGATSA